MSEADACMIIVRMLQDSKWNTPGGEGTINVNGEVSHDGGLKRADYVLYDKDNAPLCVLEAKNESKSPLTGKEQARGYANSLGCRFVILSNGISHYFWDLEQGNPTIIDVMPTQEQLELRKQKFNPSRQNTEEQDIDTDYIARTQFPDLCQHPDYIDPSLREEFLHKNKIRILRDYQLDAVKAVQRDVAAGKDRFLLEMATGTGKTLVSCAIMKMFLRLFNVRRILFLVDRIELESQAQKQFDEVLKNDFRSVVWKENQTDWQKAKIVVSTVQSFIRHNKYKKVFNPDDFDLVISDEAHRSLGRKSRKVFEYFIGFKLGLTATPKDYLKSVDIEDLAENHPKQLERRLQLDTYITFGCAGNDPTFRYSLKDGVRDKFLVNPKVYDARTKITTQLLSDQGYLFEGVDEYGNDTEVKFEKKDFEKRFFNNNTNKVWCETFFKKAMKDPYTGEIGKTLVFCVSQNHAARITQVLNVYASLIYPNHYNSDFAVQVTSDVEDASSMTTKFSNNTLNMHSNFDSNYRTSKTRACVTVGMMTTGYDCTDILNICMMRPVYSPSEFIQMKGRGTRICDFSDYWITDAEIPEISTSQKTKFFLFDFLGNYEFFEKAFKYDEVLKLPTMPNLTPEHPIEDEENSNDTTVVSVSPDYIDQIKEALISEGGMRIDNNLFRTFKKRVTIDETIRSLMRQRDIERAANYLENEVLDKPEEYFSVKKLGKALGIDRPVTIRELLDLAFGYINGLPSRTECIDEEFDKFDGLVNIAETDFDNAKIVFEAYSIDKVFRQIVDRHEYVDLNTHPLGSAFLQLPADLKQKIPDYITNSGIDTVRLQDAG